MSANLENSAAAPGLEKVRFHPDPKEAQCQRCSNYRVIVLTSHARDVLFKILPAKLQQHVNQDLLDV